MKIRFFLLFICFMQHIICYSQSNNINSVNFINDKEFEIDAEFPGGNEEFQKFINQNLKHHLFESSVSGKVIFGFTVATNGSIENVKILRNEVGEVGEYILIDVRNLLIKCPKWNPATKGGKPIKIQKTFFITVTKS